MSHSAQTEEHEGGLYGPPVDLGPRAPQHTASSSLRGLLTDRKFQCSAAPCLENTVTQGTVDIEMSQVIM